MSLNLMHDTYARKLIMTSSLSVINLVLTGFVDGIDIILIHDLIF